MTDKIIDDILTVRDTGRCNMSSINEVQHIANELDLLELVIYLEDKGNWREYTRFILTGETA